MNAVVEEVNAWLRPYQLAWHHDQSLMRVGLKGRQIGFSDGCVALEMVLVASGLHPEVFCADCNVISKKDDDAKDVIEKCKLWVRRLRLDPDLAPFLETTDDGWSATKIKFKRSEKRIRSETQNPEAARSRTGHLYLDEYAFYVWQREIWTGATPSVASDPRLRISVVSTPNGSRDHFHEIWNDKQFYPEDEWGRHYVDVYLAVEQGFPFDIEKGRRSRTADQFAQEFECQFLGAESNYFPLQLLQDSTELRPREDGAVCHLGVDTASIKDLTGVQTVFEQGVANWLGHTYILGHVPYETSPEQGIMGQDCIVDALARYYRAETTTIDRTGDEARQKQIGSYGLFFLMQRMKLGTTLIGQHISKGYKDQWVPKLKVGLTAKVVQFDEARRDYVFTPATAASFIGDDGRVPDSKLDRFVSECFQESPYPILRSDFQRVYRKWLGPNDTTFDTERDKDGHGDGFWASLLGFATASSWRQRSGQSLSQMYEAAEERPRRHDPEMPVAMVQNNHRRRNSEPQSDGFAADYMDYL